MHVALILFVLSSLTAVNLTEQSVPCHVVRYRDVTGDATTKVAASYPNEPDLKVTGTVKVLVSIDRSGNVVSARAICGHPLLYAPSVAAARLWKFGPPPTSQRKHKRIGLIAFSFTQPPTSR